MNKEDWDSELEGSVSNLNIPYEENPTASSISPNNTNGQERQLGKVAVCGVARTCTNKDIKLFIESAVPGVKVDMVKVVIPAFQIKRGRKARGNAFVNLGSDDEAQAVVAFFKQYNSMGGFELTDDNGSITSVRVNFVPHTKYSRQKSNNSNNPKNQRQSLSVDDVVDVRYVKANNAEVIEGSQETLNYLSVDPVSSFPRDFCSSSVASVPETFAGTGIKSIIDTTSDFETKQQDMQQSIDFDKTRDVRQAPTNGRPTNHKYKQNDPYTCINEQLVIYSIPKDTTSDEMLELIQNHAPYTTITRFYLHRPKKPKTVKRRGGSVTQLWTMIAFVTCDTIAAAQRIMDLMRGKTLVNKAGVESVLAAFPSYSMRKPNAGVTVNSGTNYGQGLIKDTTNHSITEGDSVKSFVNTQRQHLPKTSNVHNNDNRHQAWVQNLDLNNQVLLRSFKETFVDSQDSQSKLISKIELLEDSLKRRLPVYFVSQLELYNLRLKEKHLKERCMKLEVDVEAQKIELQDWQELCSQIGFL